MKETVLATYVVQAMIDMADLAISMDIGDHITGIPLAWLWWSSSPSSCLCVVVVVLSSVSL